MLFAAPALLLALPALAALWWLLRLTPPLPRRQRFPAIALLAGIATAEETPARTPPWVLALRLLAAALIVLGLAGPILRPGAVLPGRGTLLLVIDNGWAAAPAWPRVQRAAAGVLARAARAGRKVVLLATAADASGAPPRPTPALPAAALAARLAALRPQAWPPDRPADLVALRASCVPSCPGAAIYLADGLTDGPGYAAFARALAALGPLRALRPATPPLLLLPPEPRPDGLRLRLATTARPIPTRATILAETSAGATLAASEVTIPAGAAIGSALLRLPPGPRNRIRRLVLSVGASAGTVVPLDAGFGRPQVGLATDNPTAAERPFLGPLYYVTRALTPYAAVRAAPLAHLAHSHATMIVLADTAPAGVETAALTAWIRRGGVLLRFAGPALAAGATDKLLPERLLAGDRALGGAMSWSRPEHLARFPPTSPFAGLAVPADVTVRRQVLARPSARLAAQSWASLTDGTPLVTARPEGRGWVVLFHVTANAAWSNLPLSGLFVAMLRRLTRLTPGRPPAAGARGAVLAPWRVLDGSGALVRPGTAARGLTAAALARAAASPADPPGIYGPPGDRRARPLAGGVGLPQTAPGAPGLGFGALAPGLALGGWLVAAGAALLAVDLLIALRLRGLLWLTTLLVAGLAAGIPARAAVPTAALQIRLAYVVTGSARIDRISRQGLIGLSALVSERTAAFLGPPDPVVPGASDLSLYPLLYWPVLADAPAPSAAAAAALRRFMARGGIVVLDTGTGNGGQPDPAALRRALSGIAVAPLTRLTIHHVLARSFYLLRRYPGRYAGGAVWVTRRDARAGDDVSPVVIGAADWAAAWAIDRDGRTAYATVPGGGEQRELADRFGINLVMYALTGNYKGDRLQLRAIIQRMGR